MAGVYQGHVIKSPAQERFAVVTTLGGYASPTMGVVGQQGSLGLADVRTSSLAELGRLPSGGFTPLSAGLSCDGVYLAVGTEQKNRADAPVYLFDVRRPGEPVWTFGDMHNDDVCHIQFAHANPNRFMSSSTDGLVNVVDLEHQPPPVPGLEPDPDTAGPEDWIVHSLNTASSVSRSRYFGPDDSYGAALTHDQDVHIFHALAVPEEADEQIMTFSDARHLIEAQTGYHTDYLVDMFYDPAPMQLYLLAGQTGGPAQLLHMSSVRNALPYNASSTTYKRPIHASISRMLTLCLLVLTATQSQFTEVARLDDPTYDTLYSMAYSPATRVLAAGDQGSHVMVWQLASA
ncbi:uncharacterized protein MONBRDRAFT_22957 [Monosiga brevicollis MX1]|uniref:Uncharacterized protein n=1 Tax=Monosiga brevicollis TaxID=81824 RepID=A9USK8_MONBE|nr:uncharacterized protein MONBRDRAFT_22957 [Monosiga brevicollis MX1]EDQ91797.1 predicted protein [Monosiga brevicollis MX1]|eukprot:XP_001743083.1 hypothetical protein [Monosiga brevicollis MX1]